MTVSQNVLDILKVIRENQKKDPKWQNRLKAARCIPSRNAKYGKPPKLRYQPGDFVEYEGEVWVVKFMYRRKDDPHVWVHVLENMPKKVTAMDEYIASLNLGEGVPLIVYDPVWDLYDKALQSQTWLPCWGDSRIAMRSPDMIKKTKKIDPI